MQQARLVEMQGQASAEGSSQKRQKQAGSSHDLAAEQPEEREERDAEAEEELTSAARSDPLAAYDVEVDLEGQAIREFLGLLAGDTAG